MFFLFVCLKVDESINGGGEGLISGEGRGTYNQKFTVIN